MQRKVYKLITEVSVIFFALSFFLVPSISNAASLSLSPSSATVNVGNIVTLKISVNTSGVNINNAEGVIQYPTDMLDVVSINKSSSVFNLWVEEPKFSNSTGKITFNGGVANPGYNGSSGTVASVTFKAKKQGQASVLFSDGAVRQNDGLGTDVLSAKNSSTIQITQAKETPVIETPPSTPAVVDNVPPKAFTPTIRGENNKFYIKLDAVDLKSGIDHYTLKIDANTILVVNKSELINSEYLLPPLDAGKYTILVTAYDKSGNHTDANVEFIAPEISSPQIVLNSDVATVGESLTVSGTTIYPNSIVLVTLVQDNHVLNTFKQKTDSNGLFTLKIDGTLKSGVVGVYAESVLSDKVQSDPSPTLYVNISETGTIKITKTIVEGILVFSLLFILVMALYIGWHKFFGLKKKIDNELKQTITDVHKATMILKDELSDQLVKLEKIKEDRALNKKEKAIFDEIKNNIDTIDEFIEKKLKKLM